MKRGGFFRKLAIDIASDFSHNAGSDEDDTRSRCLPTGKSCREVYDARTTHVVDKEPHMNANFRAAVIAALATLTLAACDRGPGERTVGQKLDNAIDKTQQKLAEAGEKTSQKLAEAGDKTQVALANAADKVAVKTGEAVSAVQDATVAPVSIGATETGKVMNDTAITASIKTDFLKDPDLSVLKIDVDTKGGVVTLNGLAGDEAARVRAEKMASAIKGVKEVRNFLVVKRA
jgi:hyperosmotically inducible protein